jgi:uncharacterized membrane-anchored protein YhcB (DUF1043 family)
MAIVYSMSLVAALLAGLAIGWLATFLYYGHVASQQREYEREMAEVQELNAARAMLRRLKPNQSTEDD